MKITEKHIDDPELGIDTFIEQMAISRMQLYRKIAALTNMTVKEFVNDIRLRRAAQILSNKNIRVSEVAYSVGLVINPILVNALNESTAWALRSINRKNIRFSA